MRDLQNLQIGSRLIVPKHTPLPWRIHLSPAGGFSIEADSTAVLCGRNDWPHRAEEARANAHLFFAAPRMLTSLGIAYHALQSYAYGNSAPDLAASIAAGIGKLLIEATEGAEVDECPGCGGSHA